MVKFKMDMLWELFDGKISDGEDITSNPLFSPGGDLFLPPGATVKVIKAEGSGGGNPEVEYTFVNDDDSWEWYLNQYAPFIHEEPTVGDYEWILSCV